MKPIPIPCHKMMAEAASAPFVGIQPGDTDSTVRARQEAHLLTLAHKHGVTIELAEDALAFSASRMFAEDWVSGLDMGRYRLEYSVRSGACEVWGLLVKLLRAESVASGSAGSGRGSAPATSESEVSP